jgi:hypothetical protein
MFSSKKFVATFTAILASVLALGLGKVVGGEAGSALADKVATLVAGCAVAYVLAQGAADHGKEAAKVDKT